MGEVMSWTEQRASVLNLAGNGGIKGLEPSRRLRRRIIKEIFVKSSAKFALNWSIHLLEFAHGPMRISIAFRRASASAPFEQLGSKKHNMNLKKGRVRSSSGN